MQDVVYPAAQGHSPAPDKSDGRLPRLLPPHGPLDCCPVTTSGLNDEDQLPRHQAIGRLKRASRTVRYQVHLVDPESTMAISRQPQLAVPVHRYGNGEHTTRKATDRHPDAAFTLAEQQLHIHSALGILAEAGHQFRHYTIN
jgi:hypothetical protein